MRSSLSSPKRLGIGIIILLLASAGVFWWAGRGPRESASPRPEQVKLEALLAGDRSLLQRQPPAPEPEQTAALLRLSQRGDSLARELALKHAGAASPSLRQAAAAALASFHDPDALTRLLALLADTETSVRAEALASLGRHADAPAAREAALAAFARKDLTAAERAAAAGSVLRLTAAEHPEREAAILALVELAGSAAELSLQIQGVSELSALAPEHPRFLELLRRILATRKPAVLFPLALRHLLSAPASAAADAPRIATSALEWVADPDVAVRLAVVQTLHRSCPESRAAILDKAIRSPGQAMQVATIEQVAHMPTAPIRELARGWLRDKLIRDPALVARLELILKNSEEKPRDLCAPSAVR